MVLCPTTQQEAGNQYSELSELIFVHFTVGGGKGGGLREHSFYGGFPL